MDCSANPKNKGDSVRKEKKRKKKEREKEKQKRKEKKRTGPAILLIIYYIPETDALK